MTPVNHSPFTPLMEPADQFCSPARSLDRGQIDPAKQRGSRPRRVPGECRLGYSLVRLGGVALLAGICSAQTLNLELPAQLAWQSRWDAPIEARDVGLATTTQGSVIYATGYSVLGLPHLRTVAFDTATSSTLWDQTYGAGTDAETTGLGIALAPNTGRVYVRGTARLVPGQPVDGGLLAYAANSGQLLWSRTLTSGASLSYEELVTAMVLSSDGARLYVTLGANPDGFGAFPAGAPNSLAKLIALDASNGNTLWEQSLAITEGARQLVLSADQTRLFVTGANYSGSVYSSFISVTSVEARNAVDGALLWNKSLGSNAPGLAGGRDLALSADGQTLYVCADDPTVQVGALSTSDGTTQWTFGQAGFRAQRGLVLSQGGLAVAGWAGSDLAARRLNAAGSAVWEQTFSVFQRPEELLQDAASGNILLASTSWPQAQDGSRSVRSLDLATGSLLWERTLGVGNGNQEYGGDIATLGSGELASVGSLFLPATDQGFLIERLRSSDGALLDSKSFESVASGDQAVGDMQLDALANRLISIGSAGEKVGGIAGPSWGAKQAWVQAQSAANGQLLWSSFIQPTSTAPTTPTALQVEPGGSQVFVGGVQDTDQHFVAALDAATGAQQWKTLGNLWNSSLEQVYDLTSASTNPHVFAVTFSPYIYHVAARHKQNGALVWSYTSPPADLASEPELILSPDGNRLYLIGASQGQLGSFTDMLVVCLDAHSGTQLWVTQFDPTGQQEFWDHDDVAASVLSSDGSSLFLLGLSTLDAQFQTGYLYARLDALTGQVLWHNAFPQPGVQHLYPRDLQLSPDGLQVFGVGMEVLSVFPSTRGLSVQGLDATSGQLLFKQLVETGYEIDATDLVLDADGSKGYVLGWYGVGFLNYEALFTAFDSQTGQRLWGGKLTSPVGTPEHARRAVQSPDGERLLIAAQSGTATTYRDLTVLAIDLPELTAFPSSLSLAAGGTQHFDLSGHGAQGNAVALLLGSLSGTTPGLALPGGLLPLNPDAYFTLTLTAPNQPPLSGSLGLLSPSGHREASLTLPAGSLPALAGSTVQHAWVALQSGTISLISNPIGLTLLP